VPFGSVPINYTPPPQVRPMKHHYQHAPPLRQHPQCPTLFQADMYHTLFIRRRHYYFTEYAKITQPTLRLHPIIILPNRTVVKRQLAHHRDCCCSLQPFNMETFNGYSRAAHAIDRKTIQRRGLDNHWSIVFLKQNECLIAFKKIINPAFRSNRRVNLSLMVLDTEILMRMTPKVEHRDK